MMFGLSFGEHRTIPQGSFMLWLSSLCKCQVLLLGCGNRNAPHESNFLAGYSLLIGSTAGICSDGAISILIQAIVVLCATLVQRKTFCIFSLTALLRPPAGSLYTYIGQMILIYMQSFLLAGRIVHMVFSRRFSQLLPGNFGSYGMTKSLTMAMLAEDFAFLVSKSKFTFSS